MNNYIFIKNILILIFSIILIHLFLNYFLKKINYINNDEFNNTTKNTNKIKVYLFYADWCGHCKDYKPIFNKFKNIVQDHNIDIIEINADDDNENKNILYKKYNIEGFPTTIIDNNNKIIKLVGKNTIDKLLNSVNFKTDNDNNDNDNNDNDNNNDDNNDDNINIYNFNTSWCKYSIDFQTEWNTFSNSLISLNNIKSIDIKCDNDINKDLCKKYNISSYPTIIIESKDNTHIYEGPRTSNDLRKYLKLN